MSGFTTIWLSNGADTHQGGAADDLIQGGAEADPTADVGADRISGGGGADTLFGQGGADTLRGEAGDDLLLTGASIQTVSVERGFGGDGADTIIGGLLRQFLSGGLGADSLVGEAGDDQLFDHEDISGAHDFAADTLLGGDGNDLLQSRSGADSLDGGAGVDHAHLFRSYLAVPLVFDFAGPEAVTEMIGADLRVTGIESFFLAGGQADDLLRGGGGNDEIWGNDGADTLDGRGGRDTLRGGLGDDRYLVDVGQDAIDDAGGRDTVEGALNFDLAAQYGGVVEAVLLTGAANRNAFGNEADNALIGNAGANSLAGLGGADTILAGEGNDTTEGGAGDDLIEGGGGSDVLVGGAGADTLLGGEGDDQFLGFGDGDLIEGGAGVDVVLLTGLRMDYLVDAVVGGFVLTDRRTDPLTNPDGADTILGVETFRFFLDGDIAAVDLLAPRGATAEAPVPFSGVAEVDALLGGGRWTSAVLRFGFPPAASDYPASYEFGGPTNGFEPAAPAQMQVIRQALAGTPATDPAYLFRYGSVASLTGLGFVEGGPGERLDIAVARSADPAAQGQSAYAILPQPFFRTGAGTRPEVGDIFLGTQSAGTLFDLATPVPGSTAFMTHLHEIGHALGLKHPHEAELYNDLILSTAWDSPEFTLMSYRAHAGAGLSTHLPAIGDAPQSFMMLDIAALQHLYGANYATAAGDTVYRWDATTGEMSLNGVAQGPPLANTVFLTIWDGGGRDTYDFSNHAGGVRADLAPGGHSITAETQRAWLNALPAGDPPVLARGNVFNALLHQGDTRSLIENAIGGIGHDTLHGNQGANSLMGGGGVDELMGGGGHDTLDGGAGNDLAVFSGIRTDYLVAVVTGGLVLMDQRAGGDGTDTVRNVERFRFADGLHTAAQLSAGGGVNLPPALLTTALVVAENIQAVGGILASDPNGDALGFAFAPGGPDNARFTLDTATGALAFVSAAGGDFEDEPHFTIRVRVTDSGGLFAEGDVAITLTDVVDEFATTEGGDSIPGGAAAETWHGLGGNDTFAGSPGADRLDGGPGDDAVRFTTATRLDLRSPANSTGEAAGDTYISIERFEGSAFADTLLGSNLPDHLVGGAGNDHLGANAGADTLDGGGGGDSLAGGAGNNLLRGGLGNDTINGGAGADTVQGNNGGDRLITGADGARDVFVYGSPSDGNDTIVGFVSGEDAVLLSKSGFGLEEEFALGEGTYLVGGFGLLAQGPLPQFILDTSRKQIIFDWNGNAQGGRILMMTFTTAFDPLTDFVFVA